MRWREYEPCKMGDTRTVCRFLWWPLKIGKETRWLELADLVQELVNDEHPSHMHPLWQTVAFAPDPEWDGTEL